MKLIGYGEDSLTLWAVTEQLGTIHAELKDGTDPSDCLGIYRRALRLF